MSRALLNRVEALEALVKELQEKLLEQEKKESTKRGRTSSNNS